MDVVVNSAGLFSVATDFTDVTSNVTSNKAKKLNWLYVILDRSDRRSSEGYKTVYAYISFVLII